MSFKAQQWALEQQDVKGIDKWVLFILAYRDNHDEPHGCFPSLKRIALDCGIARSTVQLSVQRLIGMGKIRIFSRRNKRGSESHWYTIPEVWVGAQSVHPIPTVGTPLYRPSVPNQKLNHKEPKSRAARAIAVEVNAGDYDYNQYRIKP